jgi:uncharacterized membrane-anchored protein
MGILWSAKIKLVGCSEVTMADETLGGRLALLAESPARIRKSGDVLSLEARLIASENLVEVQGKTNQQTASKLADLEMRFKQIQLLLVWLAEAIIAIASILVAGLVGFCLQGGDFSIPISALAVVGGLAAFLGANLVLRRVMASLAAGIATAQ